MGGSFGVLPSTLFFLSSTAACLAWQNWLLHNDKSYFYFDKKQSSCRWSYYFCEERPVHRYFHWLPGGTVNNCSSLDILTILFLWTDSYLCENVSIILSRCLLAFAGFISWISSLPCVVQRTSQIFYYQNKLKNTTIPCSITKQW